MFSWLQITCEQSGACGQQDLILHTYANVSDDADSSQQLGLEPPEQSIICVNDREVGHHILDSNTIKARCGECGKLYNGRISLIRHWRHVHGLEGGHCCEFCGRRFGQKCHLVDHRKSCHLHKI